MLFKCFHYCVSSYLFIYVYLLHLFLLTGRRGRGNITTYVTSKKAQQQAQEQERRDKEEQHIENKHDKQKTKQINTNKTKQNQTKTSKHQ